MLEYTSVCYSIHNLEETIALDKVKIKKLQNELKEFSQNLATIVYKNHKSKAAFMIDTIKPQAQVTVTERYL